MNITTEAKRKKIIKEIESLTLNEYQITIEPIKEDRSRAQNRLSHMHYAQIGKHMGEDTDEVKTRCKLQYGIPILQAGNQDFCDKWFSLTMFNNHSQNLIVASMIPVTSILTIKQMAQYITAYMREHESNGIALSHPSDLFNLAMGVK